VIFDKKPVAAVGFRFCAFCSFLTRGGFQHLRAEQDSLVIEAILLTG